MTARRCCLLAPAAGAYLLLSAAYVTVWDMHNTDVNWGRGRP